MKCSRHLNKEVVAMCAKCNAGVCEDCATATQSLRDEYGTLCVSCYQTALGEAINYYKEDNSSKLKNIIISACLYVFGIFFALVNGTGTDYISIIVGIFFCGFYNAIAGWKKGEEVHEEHERKYGVSYNVDSEGNIERNNGFFKKLFIAAIYTVLGLVVTPFTIIKNAIIISKNKKAIESIELEMEAVSKI
ncbi:MAG: hypothetical protein IKV61_06120 [Clostridia bacterium]|nr:hypothetical protein [Clostridia bacterium]